MAYTLAVWLYGTFVAELREPRTGRLALEYTDAALEKWPVGTPLLSVSLRIRPDRRYPPSVVTPYFEGLLPEGVARSVIEDRFGVRRGDIFGLLGAIGRDCAGAVVVQPLDDPPPGIWHQLSGPVLSTADVSTAIDSLGTRPLGAGGDVRISLAGQQDKLLLSRDSDGRWIRPAGDTPSTHILKPEDARFPGSAYNEAFCATLAHRVGLADSPVEIIDVGRPVLVVPRYDRVRDEHGGVSRIHQEDMCQALSRPVDFSGAAKYEESGGPSFAQVAGILDRYAADPIAQLEKLTEVMTFTVLIGNADAHGKNLSLIHRADGSVALAPVYDAMCTAWYQDVVTPQGTRPISTNLAMTINGVADIHHVTLDDLIAEAAGWHVSSTRARSAVNGLLERAYSGIHQAADKSPADVSQLAEYIAARAAALQAGGQAGAQPPCGQSS